MRIALLFAIAILVTPACVADETPNSDSADAPGCTLATGGSNVKAADAGYDNREQGVWVFIGNQPSNKGGGWEGTLIQLYPGCADSSESN